MHVFCSLTEGFLTCQLRFQTAGLWNRARESRTATHENSRSVEMASIILLMPKKGKKPQPHMHSQCEASFVFLIAWLF